MTAWREIRHHCHLALHFRHYRAAFKKSGQVYLLSAHASLWQKTFGAVGPGRIDFAGVRLGATGIPDYVRA